MLFAQIIRKSPHGFFCSNIYYNDLGHPNGGFGFMASTQDQGRKTKHFYQITVEIFTSLFQGPKVA